MHFKGIVFLITLLSARLKTTTRQEASRRDRTDLKRQRKILVGISHRIEDHNLQENNQKAGSSTSKQFVGRSLMSKSCCYPDFYICYHRTQ